MKTKYNIKQILEFYRVCNEYYNIEDGLHPTSTSEEILDTVEDYLITIDSSEPLSHSDICKIGNLLNVRKEADTEVIGGVDFTDSIDALNDLGKNLVK